MNFLCLHASAVICAGRIKSGHKYLKQKPLGVVTAKHELLGYEKDGFHLSAIKNVQNRKIETRYK